MFKTTLKTLVIIGGLLGLLSATGCTTAAKQVKADEISIERVDSKSMNIINAYVETTDSILVLKGKIQCRSYTSRLMPGYLRVELLGPNGKAFKVANIGYKRVNTKSHLARFHVLIPIDASQISQIRITHVDTDKDNLDLYQSPWNDVKAI